MALMASIAFLEWQDTLRVSGIGKVWYGALEII